MTFTTDKTRVAKPDTAVKAKRITRLRAEVTC